MFVCIYIFVLHIYIHFFLTFLVSAFQAINPLSMKYDIYWYEVIYTIHLISF